MTAAGLGCAGGGIDVPQSSGLGTAAGTSATTAGMTSTPGEGSSGGESSDTDGPPGTTVSGSASATVSSTMGDTDPSGSGTDDPSAESSGPPPPSCGDGNVDPGEACDDANADETDACLSSCAEASCGDGFVRAGAEACDDANADETDACLSSCIAASCGDGFVHAGVEVCDDTVNDGAYGGCNPGCAALAPYCGDGAVQSGVERCEGATGYANIACTNCGFDFAAITQLYCFGTCSLAGAQGCDQADADVYCRLVSGDPNSVALSFQVLGTLQAPGFACPNYATNLGAFPEYGVANDVWYEDTDLYPTHGGGQVVGNITCS